MAKTSMKIKQQLSLIHILETEGNRSCKTRFNQVSSVEGRRRGIRSDTKGLHHQTEQEGKESCSQVCSDQPCSG